MRDGRADAIHDARVATRRLRAALPLAWADSPNTAWAEPAETIRQLGAALGRVRELDVAVAQLPSLEARLPPAAATVAELRMDLARQQWSERRRLIKALEQLALDRARALTLVPARRLSLLADRRWRAVERAIIGHSESLRNAVVAASGVYFPNRAHRVRVETKKLRYVLELVPHAAGARKAVKQLKRAQELLGQLHDHQTLVDIVSATNVGKKAGRRLLLASLEAACHDLFHQYLAHRTKVLDVCRDVHSAVSHAEWRPRTLGGTLLTAGAIAAPSALLLLTRRSGRHAPPAARERRTGVPPSAEDATPTVAVPVRATTAPR